MRIGISGQRLSGDIEAAASPGLSVETAAPPRIRHMVEDARRDELGFLFVRGWATAPAGIATIQAFVGGAELADMQTHLPREDVALVHADHPDPGRSGFVLATRLPRNDAAAAVRLVYTSGDDGRLEVAVPLALVRRLDEDEACRAFSTPGGERSRQPATCQFLEEASVSAQGVLRVRGWMLSLSPIDEIRVFLDGRLLGLAERNMLREDVSAIYPEYPNSENPGFLLLRELGDEELTARAVRVSVTTLGGITRDMTLPCSMPQAIRRHRHRDNTIRFHCDSVSLTEDGAVSIEGWAVCPTGIAGIEVTIDDMPTGAAEIGLDRPDVGNCFPLLPSARTAGFRFATKLEGRYEGEHVLAVRVRGGANEDHLVPLSVRSLPSARAVGVGNSGDAGLRFFVDRPVLNGGAAIETVRGSLTVEGWAVSPNGIALVEIFLDGAALQSAYYGVRREDIHRVFPSMAGSLLSGFGSHVPPNSLPEGPHTCRVVVHDKNGGKAQTEFSIVAEKASDATGPSSLRTKLTQAESDLHLAQLAALDYRPVHSILLRLRDCGRAELRKAAATISTLRRQVYGEWRATVALPAGADADACRAALLSGHDDVAHRFSFPPGSQDLRCAELLAPTEGRPVLFSLLRAGDRLGADALLQLSVALGLRPDADFVYSDERRFDPGLRSVAAYFKPRWSPDLLLSTNYIGRLWAARAELIGRAGIAPGELFEHGEYDMVLRLTEAAAGIDHVAAVLCERGGKYLDSAAAERRALRGALLRRGIKATLEPGCLPGTHRVKRTLETRGKVSIIIPTIAAGGFIKTAIESIRAKTAYRNFEIVCVDNIPKSNPVWKLWLRQNADRVVAAPEKFNWSRFNNKGAAAASGEFLLFLNDDIEIVDPDWLRALLEHAQRPEIGVVGPQLLYPDGRVQQAGLFLAQGNARHAFRFTAKDDPGPFGLALTQRNMIAVTGACMMVRREAFDALGGFDESHGVVNNDVDFALRAWGMGRRVVFTPHASLIHHELASRSEMKDDFDTTAFTRSWARTFRIGDPFFNPRLTQDFDDYRAEREPTEVIHVGRPIVAKQAVKRILAVKIDHIGDFITAMPALKRLKQHFPAAELCVLAAKASRAFAEIVPEIDRVIEFDFFHARSERGRRKLTLSEVKRLRDTLGSYRFDLAIDLRRQPDTRAVLLHTNATWLAGYDHRSQFPWLDMALEWEGDGTTQAKRAHVSDALVHLVEAVAASCGTDRHALSRAGDQQALARAALVQLPVLESVAGKLFEAPLVCIHPAVGNPTRQWPPEYFAALIDLLAEGEQANVVLIGGPDEAAVAGQVLARVRSRESVFSLIGKTRLTDLPNMLQACDLFVGNNSGPHHLAAALGVPTVGVHSGVVDAAEWGPLGPLALAVRRNMSCSPCYKEKVADCRRNLACLRGLYPGDVYDACRRMLVLRAGPAGRNVTSGTA